MLGKSLFKMLCCGALVLATSVMATGDGYDEEELAHQHTWTERANITATCEKDGITYFVCDCGEEKQETEEAQGHTYERINVLYKETCEEAGLAVLECTACKDCIEETLEALGHNLEKIAEQAPSCHSVGWMAHEACTRCDYTTKQEIHKVEHDWDDGKESQWGLQYTCLTCGEIQIVGHTHIWENEEIFKHPTCTETGEKHYVCRCGYIKTEILAKVEHQPILVNGGEATCTQAGTTDGEECMHCGAVVSKQQFIPALGHSWDDGVYTADGILYTCVRCLETQHSDEQHEHEYGAWEIIEKATCLQAGKRVCVCVFCNQPKEELIPIAEHSFENGICQLCETKENIKDSASVEEDGTEESPENSSSMGDSAEENSAESSSAEDDYSEDSASSEDGTSSENSEESEGGTSSESSEEKTEEDIDLAVLLDFAYEADEDAYICTGISEGLDILDCWEIVIPDTYDGKPVVEIEKGAFYGCSSLLRVTIGANVKKIGKGAFYGASEVLEVYNRSTIPNKKLEIYGQDITFIDEPFTENFKKDNQGFITYKKGKEKYLVRYIGNETEITLPEDITAIRPNALRGCCIIK